MGECLSPEFSVVIPARNEERFLPRCLNSLTKAARASGASLEVIVVLNRCTDRTEEIARQAGAICVREDAKNLSKIRNAGARMARGEVLVTVDADSWVSENLFKVIREELETGRVIGGGVLIIPERLSVGIVATAIALLPILVLRGLSAGLFFCRRADFFRINGFNEQLFTAEDVDFALRLKQLGRAERKRFANIYRAWIWTSCRKFDRFGDWYLLRNPLESIRMLRGRDSSLGNRYWYDVPREH